MFDCVIVNYNTHLLTGACIKSLRNSGTDCNIFVFDNSDNGDGPYKSDDSSIVVFDNTEGQIINFETFLRQFPMVNDNNIDYKFGSAKHSKTIDLLFQMFPNGFIHLDSDIIVKRNLDELYDQNFALIGEYIPSQVNIEKPPLLYPRIHPCLMYVNVPMCNEYGIKFFDPKRNFGLTSRVMMDTGASFLQDIEKQNLPIKKICDKDYVNHLCAGSRRKNTPQKHNKFLKINEQYLK